MNSVKNNFSWQIKKRNETTALVKFIISAASIVLGFFFCGLLLMFTGTDPLELYAIMLKGAFGSSYGLSETVVKSVPLMFTSLGVLLAFRMKLWNIGAEGQLYMGAVGATFFALHVPDLPRGALLPIMFLAAMLSGGFWGLLPALPKAFWGVNETITSLMLNYVAIFFTGYLVFGPWKDPQGKTFPLTKIFSSSAALPVFGNTRINISVVIALAAAVLLYILLQRAKWGYEIRVIGESRRAAAYSGMNYARNVLLVMFLSGAISGLAGFEEVSGVIHRLQQNISPGYGYTAIIITLLARLNPLSVTLVSFLMGGLYVGGDSLQIAGYSQSIVLMFQGAILFFVLGGEIIGYYRVARVPKPQEAAG